MKQVPTLSARLHARLSEDPETPAAHAVVEEIWLAVVEGTVDCGARLPTARQLAIELGVSPRSVERAYEELERRGVAASRAGEGTFVSLAPPREEDRARHRAVAALCRETVERARALGCGIDELIEELAEYRTTREPT